MWEENNESCNSEKMKRHLGVCSFRGKLSGGDGAKEVLRYHRGTGVPV